MADNDLSETGKIEIAAIDDFTVTVSRLFAAELSDEMNRRIDPITLDRALERTVERVHERQNRQPLPIDELSFDAIRIAMDAANERAAREARDHGFEPAGRQD